MIVSRVALWYATSYTIVILVHEAAHGLAARAVGLHATLFHFWVDIDRDNAVWQRATFGSAGPVSSLAVGVASWLVYRHTRRAATAVPWLFLAACGVSNFFGNLMSTAFVGDFSNVAVWLDVPMPIRYGVSACGGIGVACVLFAAGRELRQWLPESHSRTMAATIGILLPVALGTALIILVNQPVPIPGFAAARAGEAAMWIFAAAGVASATPTVADARWTLQLSDGLAALVVVAVVRLLVSGVPLP